jgi:hypothetical protein
MNNIKKIFTYFLFLSIFTFFLTLPTVSCSENKAPRGTKGISHITEKESHKEKSENKSIVLRLNKIQFDPLKELPSDYKELLSKKTQKKEQSGYYIVQFDGPIVNSWKKSLENEGVTLFDYVPDFAFIVKMHPVKEPVVRHMPHVRWVGFYEPLFRISLSAEEKMLLNLSDNKQNKNGKTSSLYVQVFPGENIEHIKKEIIHLGGDVLNVSETKWKNTLRVSIPSQRIKDLPLISGVKWIEPVPQWMLLNNISTDIINVRVPRNHYGLYGENQLIAICDTGLDKGSSSPGNLHDDFEDGTGGSRVEQIIDLVGDGAEDINSGHGTHMAGAVLGSGILSGCSPSMNSFPDTCYAGIAPKAHLIFQAVENDSGNTLAGIPVDLYTNLFQVADNAGAHIHLNSWGTDTMDGINGASQYTSASEDVDQYMWDNPDFLIIFAAGNWGSDLDGDGVIDLSNLSSPATAKNCITVGASEGLRTSGEGHDSPWGAAWPYGSGSIWELIFSVDPISSDHVSDTPQGIAAFSSRGPVIDGRYKPDLVAPGTNILSTRSSAASGTLWGTFDSKYLWGGGTSVAAAYVAGTAALMREYLTKEKGITSPSAALIKAALLNSAQDISPGQYGTGAAQEIPNPPVPDNVQGWGRINLGNGVYPASPFNILYYDIQNSLNTDELDEFIINVSDSSKPLKVNLVWTDYPGTPAAQGGLVNDLDLEVIAPSQEVHYPDNALQKSTIETIIYDKNTPADNNSIQKRAVRFTPPAYPVYLDSTSFHFNNPPPDDPEPGSDRDVDIVVYDDDGSGRLPGTELFKKTLSYVPTGWHTIAIPNVTINEGDFYIAIEKKSSRQDITIDTEPNPLYSDRGYFFDEASSSWAESSFLPYIRAHVRSTDISPNYDRVNNAVGLTLDTPEAGQYTIKVTGRNVPQGPQSYALVVSGNIFIEHTLDVTIEGQETGSVTTRDNRIDCTTSGDECAEGYPEDTEVILTAVADGGSEFSSWSGCDTENGAECTVTMNADKTITATFDSAQHTLTLEKSGPGTGAVTSQDGGINCDGICTDDTADYTHNSIVKLTSIPAPGFTFSRWEGCNSVSPDNTECTITMDSDKTITAAFTSANPDIHTVTVNSLGTGAGKVTSNPPGIDCGQDCREDYTHGTTVTLQAEADTDSLFTGWSGGGCMGSDDCIMDVDESKTVTALFSLIPQNTLIVNIAGTGSGFVSSDDDRVNCDKDQCSQDYNEPKTVTLSAMADPGSEFSGWSGSGCSSTSICTVNVQGSKTVTAGFSLIPEYSLIVTKTGDGQGAVISNDGLLNCGGTCSHDYTKGTEVTLSATALEDSLFEGWSGGGCSGTNPCTLNIDSAKAVTAVFSLIPEYSLIIAKAGTGKGTVTSDDALINCGDTCTEDYDEGTEITLTATGNEGTVFMGWSGSGCSGTNPCTLTMDNAKAVTAFFSLVTDYTLIVTKTGMGDGLITSDDGFLDCGMECMRTYAKGTEVTITASADKRSVFTGWSGSGCASTEPCTVTMNSPQAVTATFAPIPDHMLTIEKAGLGTGLVISEDGQVICGEKCTGKYIHGSEATLTANADADAVFLGWFGGGCSGKDPCTVTINKAKTVTAMFSLLPEYTLIITKVGQGSGTVTSDDAIIACGDVCMHNYVEGTTVTLMATPSEGSLFTGWSGSGCSDEGICTVTMDSAKAVTAAFEPVPGYSSQ